MEPIRNESAVPYLQAEHLRGAEGEWRGEKEAANNDNNNSPASAPSTLSRPVENLPKHMLKMGEWQWSKNYEKKKSNM